MYRGWWALLSTKVVIWGFMGVSSCVCVHLHRLRNKVIVVNMRRAETPSAGQTPILQTRQNQISQFFQSQNWLSDFLVAIAKTTRTFWFHRDAAAPSNAEAAVIPLKLWPADSGGCESPNVSLQRTFRTEEDVRCTAALSVTRIPKALLWRACCITTSAPVRARVRV